MPGYEDDNPLFCEKSPDHKHKVKTDVASPATGYSYLVVDVECIHCKASGAVAVNEEEVCW